MIKKIAALFTAALMLFTLSSCGGAASSDASAEKLIKAVVVSSADGMLKVNAENYEMSFTTENVDAVPALEAGDKVLLTYTGTIKDADNSKAVLVGVELLSTPAASDAASSAIASPMHPGPVQTYTFYGMVKNASMNGFSVENGNGLTADFVTGDNTVFSTVDGFVDGIMVTVTYMGSYTDPDNCTVVSVVEDANDVTNTHDDADEPSAENNHNGNFDDYTSVSGTISEASMNNITLLTKTGDSIDFFLSDSTVINVAGGLGMGAQVTLVYAGTVNGSDASGCTVISITG